MKIYNDMEKSIKVGTLFSGYDSQMMALRRLEAKRPGFKADLAWWCEIDRYAIAAHNAVFPECRGRNLGDITSVDWAAVPKVDLVTWSFPCQAISVSGKAEGFKEGSGTTSALCYEAVKCFEALRPKYLLMENVKAILQEKFADDWADLRARLEALGYSNYPKLVNAKDCGAAQSRERVFMVSILNGEGYEFPEPMPPEARMRDYLEPPEAVPESIVLHGERAEMVAASIGEVESSPRMIYVGNVAPPRPKNHYPQEGRVYHCNGLCPTLMAQQRTTIVDQAGRIRRLTSREALRLMGVSDADIDRMEGAGISGYQQRKMAGNSIVVDCMAGIFENLFLKQ